MDVLREIFPSRRSAVVQALILLSLSISNAALILWLFFVCVAFTFFERYFSLYSMSNDPTILPATSMDDNKENVKDHVEKTGEIVNGVVHQDEGHDKTGHLEMNGPEHPPRDASRDLKLAEQIQPSEPVGHGNEKENIEPEKPHHDNIPSPYETAEEIVKPKGEIVHAIRPNQDLNFEEENYQIRLFAPETIKDKIDGNVVEVDHQSQADGTVVGGNELSTNREDSFVNVEKNMAEEEEEEEEEEDGEVVIPSLNKNRLQILRMEDGDVDEPRLNKSLNDAEKLIYEQATPLIISFVVESNKRGNAEATRVSEAVDSLTFDTDSLPAKTSRQLVDVVVDLEPQFKPMAVSLANDLFDESKMSNGSSVPLKSLMKCFEKTAGEVFHHGFTWSRLLTFLMLTTEVFDRLCCSSASMAREFLARWSVVAANIGLVSWLAEQDGWSKSPDGIRDENPHVSSTPRYSSAKKSGSQCKCAAMIRNIRPTQALAAAGAILAAGAAFYYFQRS